MRVVDPIATTESNFVSSTIAEPDPLAGEKEWVNTPFDGYDLTGGEVSPSVVSRAIGNDYLHTVDVSAGMIYLYDQYFNFIRSRSISRTGFTIQCGGSSNYGQSIDNYTLTWQVSSTRWDIVEHSSDLDTVVGDISYHFQSVGINSTDMVAMCGRKIDSPYQRDQYFINRLSASSYNVIRVGISSGNNGIKFNRPLDVATYGTPRAMEYRDGEFSILYSDASGTRIVFYDANFLNVTAVHSITGDTSAQPYDSYTPGKRTGLDAGGWRLLKTSTKKIYNVDTNYNHGAIYKPGDEVVKSSIHKKYRCLVDTTTDPEVGTGEVPPKWVELGATNRWAMFDGINTYQATYPSDVDVTIHPVGVVDSISIFNIENVTSIEITTSVPDTGSTYTETHDTTGKESLVTYDFPPYENPFVDIKFVGTDIKVGEVVMGTGTVLGVLLAGAVSDRIDYSRYTYDEFGELTYVPRPIVNYTTYPIRVAKIDALGVERYLDNLKGKQAVWIGNIGDGQHLVTRGTIERSPMTYDTPSVLEYQIKVRGSI